MSLFIRKPLLLAVAIALLVAGVSYCQQTDVTRFDAYVGYAFLNSPHIGLFENGVAAQVGFRPARWYSIGFDYSLSRGDLTLTPDMLPSSLQQPLLAGMAQMKAYGLLPASYALAVPAHSLTQTFAFGPQLAYRRMTHATIFFRPVFAGAIHETAKPHPADAFAQTVANELAPTGAKHDTAPFVGFGGGFDIILSKTVSIRTQADVVYDHLFNDVLNDGRFTVRFSVGPAFNFGPKIAK